MNSHLALDFIFEYIFEYFIQKDFQIEKIIRYQQFNIGAFLKYRPIRESFLFNSTKQAQFLQKVTNKRKNVFPSNYL